METDAGRAQDSLPLAATDHPWIRISFKLLEGSEDYDEAIYRGAMRASHVPVVRKSGARARVRPGHNATHNGLNYERLAAASRFSCQPRIINTVQKVVYNHFIGRLCRSMDEAVDVHVRIGSCQLVHSDHQITCG